MAHMKFGKHKVEGQKLQFAEQVSGANAVEQHPWLFSLDMLCFEDYYPWPMFTASLGLIFGMFK